MKIVLALSLAAISLAGPAAAQTLPPPSSEKADAPAVPTRADVAARADAQFARLDANHDGILSPEERRAGRPMREGRDGPDRATNAAEFRNRALRRFDRADTNHDGRLDSAERQAQRNAMHERRERTAGEMPPPAQ